MRLVGMKVDLIDLMGSDLSVVNSARVSFDKQSELIDGYMLSSKDAKLISYLARHNHWSPFAHTSIQLRLKAPIFLARQLVKHCVGGNWNEVSRRYVDSEPEFWIPHNLRKRPDASIKQGSSSERVQHNEAARDLVIRSTLQDLGTYNELLELGVAPELARVVLPQNMMTEWYWTGSLLFFARVYNQRSDVSAQREAGEIARHIQNVVQPHFPVSWEALTIGD